MTLLETHLYWYPAQSSPMGEACPQPLHFLVLISLPYVANYATRDPFQTPQPSYDHIAPIDRKHCITTFQDWYISHSKDQLIPHSKDRSISHFKESSWVSRLGKVQGGGSKNNWFKYVSCISNTKAGRCKGRVGWKNILDYWKGQANLYYPLHEQFRVGPILNTISRFSTPHLTPFLRVSSPSEHPETLTSPNQEALDPQLRAFSGVRRGRRVWRV